MALADDIEVVPVPGPCALITALIASGIDAKEFSFYGFLPINKKLRQEKMKKISLSTNTIILYEAPHKLIGTLKDLEGALGSRKIVLARELTKIHEEFITGTASELIEKIDEVKGEFVIIIEKAEEIEENMFENMSLEEHYKYYESLRV